MDENKKQNPQALGNVSPIKKEAERPTLPLIENSEPEVKISPEVSEFVQISESQVPHNEIIKASAESVPVSTAPTGMVKLPDITKKRQAEMDLKLGPTEAKAWEGMETIREIDRDELLVIKAKMSDLKKAA